MRFAAYAGTSMVLATGVIIRALHERANFYSACVYLAQSNACLMVLTNIALLGVCAGMLGLQRLLYGPLRPIEVEQLYEKAWFAVTETCLAMTIFREEVGGWFLVMFVCLLVGKVWGWIGEGRVEILEQQPPSNPRLFHARLSVSLIVSTLFDVFMLRYSIMTVLRHARPNMMVMFAFEFAVLTVTSISTAARYTISLHEASVINTQIKRRRAQLRRERESVQFPVPTPDNTQSETSAAVAGIEGDIDSIDVDVPGWEEKGRWVFYLDLTTDFLKLVLYLTFFCVLCMFYGMPIHIIRDVALTIRSFYKRITDFVRYRQATRDMNARYPDATAEDVAREDVCIICREDMRPWRQLPSPAQQQAEYGTAHSTTPTAVDERLRPKRLPCGHILHFACLRSWLERQQNCPTCRRPVLVVANVTHTREHDIANQHDRRYGRPINPQAHDHPNGNVQQPIPAQNVFNLGPLRIAFGARHGLHYGPPQQVGNNAHLNEQGPMPAGAHLPRIANALDPQRHTAGLSNRTVANFSPAHLHVQLHLMEQHLAREINGLRVQQSQLILVRALQDELARLRNTQASSEMLLSGPSAAVNQSRFVEALPSTSQVGQSFGSNPLQQSTSHSDPNLPAGMTLPVGWTVLPLQRLPGPGAAISGESNSSGTLTPHAPAQDPSPSAESLSSDACTATNSKSNLTPIDERSTMPSAGQTMIDSHQASSQPFRSSTRAEGVLSPQSPDTISHRDEDSEAESHTQQAKSEATSEDLRPQAAVSLWGINAQRPEAIPQSPKLVQSFKPAELSEDGQASSSDEVSSQSLLHSRQAKGKGKASTVEDSTDDID